MTTASCAPGTQAAGRTQHATCMHHARCPDCCMAHLLFQSHSSGGCWCGPETTDEPCTQLFASWNHTLRPNPCTVLMNVHTTCTHVLTKVFPHHTATNHDQVPTLKPRCMAAHSIRWAHIQAEGNDITLQATERAGKQAQHALS